MAFNPDEYLASTSPAFDPDAYLAETSDTGIIAPTEDKTELQKSAEEESGFRQIFDYPLNVATGAISQIRSFADTLGADNAVSKNLRSMEGYLDGLLSAQAKQDQQEVARIMQEAQDKGVVANVVAGLRALSVSPFDFLAKGAGSVLPYVIGGTVGAVIRGGTALQKAAFAGKIGVGLGAIGGAGAAKSTIYDEVKRELTDIGIPEDVVEDRARLAQEYGGENLDQILASAGLGALAAGTGIEKVLASRILKNAGSEVAKKSIKSAAFAGAKEAAPEFVQAAQQQIAGNLALQREGLDDIPTMRGVVAAATLEGAIGGILGAGINVAMPAQRQREYDASRADITFQVDRERELAFRAAEQRNAEEFLASLERENQRRLAAQDEQVNIDAEAATARSDAPNVSFPTQEEIDSIAVPVRGATVSNDVSFGTAYGQKIARTLGDYFPNTTQFSVVQGASAGYGPTSARPLFSVVDSDGNQYGRQLDSFELANATAHSLNKEVINQNVRGAILNSLETSGQAYDPETSQRLFSYGYRALSPDNNTFTSLAINEAAKTTGPQYAEGLSWREVESLPKNTDGRGYLYTPQPQTFVGAGISVAQPRVIVGLTKAQELNKKRSEEGKPERNTFTLEETKEILGDNFAAITKDVPVDPKYDKGKLINVISDLLKAKNIESDVRSQEVNSLAKSFTGVESVDSMNTGDLRLFYRNLEGLPRFSNPIKLPEFTFKPYNRENFVKASKFIQQSNARGEKAGNDQILESAGISKDDPKVDEKLSSMMADLAKQGVRNEPQQKPTAQEPTDTGIDLEPLRKALRAKLSGFGLKDISLSLERNLIKPTGEIAPAETEAMFIPAMKQVFLSLDRIDPDGSLTPEQRLNALEEVMGHEVIHAIRLLDLWTQSEWSSLESAVSKIKKPGTNQTYLQVAKQNYADQNSVVQIEEAVADMFRDYVGKRLKIAGRPQNLLERLVQFFQRLRSALAGTGFQTYGDVINRLESGEIGARERGEVRTARATEEVVSQAGMVPERLRGILGAAAPRVAAPAAPVAPAAAPAPSSADFDIGALAGADVRESRRAAPQRSPNRAAPQRSPNVVSLMRGDEKPPRVLAGKTQVATFLQERALESLGGRVRDLNSEADRDAIADDLVLEAMHEMEVQKNAMEWYDTTIERTIELLSIKHPEIKTDPNARTAFLTGLAITSQNLAVPDNLKYAEEVYNYFKKNGRFPEKGFGSKSGSIKRNFQKANKLIDGLGSMELFTEFLQSEYAVGALNTILRQHLGRTAKVGGELIDAKVYGSAVFGPKIGNGFYTNLRGDFSPVTIDMWFMRTIGRLRGKLLEFDEAKFRNQLNRLAEAEGLKGARRSKLVSRARELARQHEKDFKKFRTEYDAGIRKKSESVNAAINIVKSLKGTRDAPSTGTERAQLRDIVSRSVAKLRDRTGQDIPPAAFQALIWYPEQDLYKKLGVKLKHVRQDYANSTKQFLRSEGINERELQRAEDRVRSRRKRGAGRVRPGAVPDVKAAVAGAGRRAGEAVLGEQGQAPEVVRESRRPKAQLDQAVAKAEADVASTPITSVPLYNPAASPEALYVAQNPDEGLKLTPEEKIRYARNNQPQYQPGVEQVLDKLTQDPPTQTPAQTVITSMRMPPFRDAIDKIRQKLILNYSRLEFYNKAHPSLKQNTAAVSSLAAAEFADRSKAIFAAAVKSGIPVYRDGGFTVDPFIHNGREYKNGLIDVLAPLYNNPYGVSLERLAQAYAIARRGQRLTREGKLIPGDPADIQTLQAEAGRFTNPDTGRPIIEEWYDAWQAYNAGTIKFLRDTGMIDDAGAQLWLNQSDYFPFYRTDKKGNDISNPKVFGGLTSVTNLKALQGGTDAINTPLMEAILTNLDAAIAMGMKNVAQQRIVRDMINIGLGSMVQPGQSVDGLPVVTFKVQGKKYSAIIDDPLIFESMQAVPEVGLDGLLGAVLRTPANVFRELITREPGYLIANMLRDTASVSLTSGANIIPVVDTVRNFASGLENLEKFGVVGGYDFSRDPKDIVKFLSEEARKRGHEFPVRDETKWDQVVNSNYVRPISKLWDLMGKASDMSEASTRNAVYQDTLARTGDWVQAAYDALSVINYGRRGRSTGLRLLTASVPFLNARIQGLDKLYQAGMGRTGPSVDRKKNILRFVTRAGLMVGLTALYYAAVSDDELYENENAEVRDNYYIIPIEKADLAKGNPGFAFKIPIPFEVGILFKTIPERILDAHYKDAPSKDLKDTLKRATFGTFGFNPIPQTVLPIAEMISNYDTFTGRSIVPYYMQDRDAIAQSQFGTNELARRMGEATGISPLKLEHLMNGYFGSLGTYTLDVVDNVLRDNDRAYPKLKWYEYPVARRFFTTANRPGLQQQFYELDSRVNGILQSINTLKKENRIDELQAYMMENQNMLAINSNVKVLDKMMTNYRNQKNAVLRMDIDPQEKRKIIDELDRAMNMNLKVIPEIRRSAYREQQQARE